MNPTYSPSLDPRKVPARSSRGHRAFYMESRNVDFLPAHLNFCSFASLFWQSLGVSRPPQRFRRYSEACFGGTRSVLESARSVLLANAAHLEGTCSVLGDLVLEKRRAQWVVEWGFGALWETTIGSAAVLFIERARSMAAVLKTGTRRLKWSERRGWNPFFLRGREIRCAKNTGKCGFVQILTLHWISGCCWRFLLVIKQAEVELILSLSV